VSSILRSFVLLVFVAWSFSGFADDEEENVLLPEVLHSFSIGIPDFNSGAIPGGDGNFYGVTRAGGKGEGTVFKVTPAGVVSVLVEFGNPASEARGRRPAGTLVDGGAGVFYGVTEEGGRFGNGTIFRVTTAGVIKTLVDFSDEDDAAAPGAYPSAGLTLGADGNFYGTTRSSSNDRGTIFRISPAERFESLATFTGTSGTLPGESPSSRLVQRPDGTLVGLAYGGGKFNLGTIFLVDPDGHPQRSISFGPTTGPETLKGFNVIFDLVCAADGTIYGALYDDSSNGHVWQLPLSGAPSYLADVLQDMNGVSLYGFQPAIGLTPGGDVLVAVTYDDDGYGGIYKVAATGGTVSRLGAFPAFPGRPSYDFNTTTIGSDGTGGYIGSYFGLLYRATGAGVITLLASPNGDGGSGSGAVPAAPVVFAPVGAPNAGTLYGYCRFGGANDNGTIFKLPAGGSFSALASLPQQHRLGNNAARPEITPDGAGNLLLPGEGATNAGGILKVDPSGVVSEIATFDFDNAPNNFAQDPYGRLTPDGAGGFYGLAQPHGSIYSSTTLAATVFHLTALNALEFVGNVPKISGNGNLQPDGHLTTDSLGNLFGTVASYNNQSSGLIYRMTPAGVYSAVADLFAASNRTGAHKPVGPIVREGGANSFIFPAVGDSGDQLLRLTTSSTIQRVFFFDPEDDNQEFFDNNYTVSPLVRMNDGTLYGLTEGGGEEGEGFLYRLAPNGTFTMLYSFKTGMEAGNPGYPGNPGHRGDQNTPGLTLGPDGLIYGVSGQGGVAGGGVLFRFATVPQTTSTTIAPTTVTAHTAILEGSLMNNGFAGTYWFTGGIDGEPEVTDPTNRTAFAGFNGTQTFSNFPTDLKGHSSYHFQFHTSVGPNPAVETAGATLSFTTPNGAPQPQNDTIIVTAASGDFPGDVLANDIDLDGDTVSIDSIAIQPAFGTVVIADDHKSLKYQPGVNFVGAKQDSFTYKVSDNYSGGALTATATVNVLLDSTVLGDYAGLLFDAPASSNLPPEAAAVPSPDQIAAGFAQLALSRTRAFTARFDIGGRSVAVKGAVSATRDTPLRGDRGRLTGTFRPLPAGTEGRVTYNGRTLVLRAGQGFGAAGGAVVPPSDFTMRLAPDQVRDPIAGDGLPAGSGFAVVRRGKKDRAVIVGVLPDGTAFSKKSVIGATHTLPFFTSIYRDKSGSLNGELAIADTTAGEIDNAPGKTTHWQKESNDDDKRFAGGFAMTMTPYGGKYKVPARGKPPLTVPMGGVLLATFDRGGLFSARSTAFSFTGAKPVVSPVIENSAHATLKFDARTGLINGAFRPGTKAVKYRGVVVQRDNDCSGFFVGTADTGSVELAF
jgi:uncharacterized repeat protein (TIGR03803 family)